MDDNGVLPDNEDDYKKIRQSLLELISSKQNMDFVDSLPLRILVSHWLTRYGIWYMLLKLFYFLLSMTALSYLFINAAYSREPRQLINFDTAKNSIQVFSLIFVLLGWLMHLIFEVCEVGLRCKARWNTLRTRHKETEGLISFQRDMVYLFQSLGFGLFDYLRCLHNFIDLGIILSLPLFLVFCAYDSPLLWYFASSLYFMRSLEIVKLLTVSPFGIYVHIIWTTLSGDLPKFLFIVVLSLFTFSGTLFIALRAPSVNYTIQTPPISELDLLNPNGVTEYWWLVLTSVRFLIEQGSVVKVDYLNIFNWFAVLIFFLMLGWILLILRVIFIAHVTNTYAMSRSRAERYVTAYKLEFLLKMQQNSLISLFVDLKKKFYNPTLEIGRKEMRKYFESEATYAHWNSTWVDRVEEALTTRRKRNLQYKDKQLFNMGLACTDPIEASNPGLQMRDEESSISEGPKKKQNIGAHPSIEVMCLLDQHHDNLKTEFNTLIEENERKIEQKQFVKRREFNEKIDELLHMMRYLIRRMERSNSYNEADDLNFSERD